MGIQLANGNTFFIFKKTGVIDIERSLDYFYGQAGELFSFYRIPKALFQEQRFQTLSTDAKTLYGILLDRMSLSAKNGWLDEQGRVFIIFTIEDVKRALCCADNKATKMLRELEEFGLIERKRRGLGKPSLVYVKNFSAESLKSIFQNRDFNDSGGFKSASQDPAKSRCNKTEENNTEKSETNPFYSEEDDGMSKREQLEEYFSQSLEIETLLRLCPDDEDMSKPKIAFICVHNSCRSQIAEAFGKVLAADVFESYSAGTETKPQINQDAVRLMKELYGIDMEKTQYSKLIPAIPKPDIAISMGCNVSCPFIGRPFDENWGLDDPTGKSDDEFKAVIEQIRQNVLALKSKLCGFSF